MKEAEMLQATISTLRERLRLCRQEWGLLEDDVASLVDVDHSTVSNWEAGRRIPKMGKLLRLVNFYGVTLDYLFGLADESERDSSAVRTAKSSVQAQLLRIRLSDAPSERFRRVYQTAQQEAPLVFNSSRVAAYLLISEATLGRYNTGGSVPADVITRFAVMTGLPLEWFFPRPHQ